MHGRILLLPITIERFMEIYLVSYLLFVTVFRYLLSISVFLVTVHNCVCMHLGEQQTWNLCNRCLRSLLAV
jgi:hypothetical protein